MAVLPIETLVPASGAVPSNAYDPESPGAFTQWEVGDEARFSVIVPDTYMAGQDLFLRLQLSSSAGSARHRWEIRTLLLRPSVNVTDEQLYAETCTKDHVSSSTSDQLTAVTWTITGSVEPGHVSQAQIMPGDLLSVSLKRVAASPGDDTYALKVFDISMVVRLDDTAISDCAARVGKIFDTVRDLFNETTGGFLPDAFILRSINRCQQELAQNGYWRRESWIPASSGASRTDLLSAIPNYQDIYQVHFSGQRHPMTPLRSFQDYEELKTAGVVPGTPDYYVVQNNSIYVWPPPSQATQSGFCVYHSYLPEDLTCSQDNANPPIPPAHDMVFVYFVLKHAFLRDRHAPGADVKFAEYAQLYEREKQALLGEAEPPRLGVRPSR